MLFFFVISLSFVVASEPYLITQELIDDVNSQNAGWTAGINPVFAGKKFSDVKMMIMGVDALLSGSSINIPKVEAPENYVAPKKFDTYKKWPQCKTSIMQQGKCSACWAVSGAQALSDRFCVAGHGNVPLSTQDLISCKSGGCLGESLQKTWEFLKIGIVSSDCFPYKSVEGYVPKCPNKCENSEKWDESIHKCGELHSYPYNSSLYAIQTGGSIQGGMKVYTDFFSYKSGVYKHVSGAVSGSHAIKIQGWGIDNGTPYWNVANTWGASWGMSGYFWIKRGSDECNIEDALFACDVK